jgi:uncharacterized membrane protein
MMQLQPTLPTILLAAATGARTMTGLAATARSVAAREPDAAQLQPARFVSSRSVAGATAALGMIELLADKLPGIPNRTDALPLLGRAAAGALIGASIAASGQRDRAAGAAVGAVVALLSAHLSFRARRALADHLAPTTAAVVEDVVVCSVAAAGVAMMNRRAATWRRLAPYDSQAEGWPAPTLLP